VRKTALRSTANVLGGQTVAALRKEIEESDSEELFGLCRKLIIIIISKVNTAYRGPRWGSA